jgi:hypothetical protein
MFPNENTANQEVGQAIRVPGSLNPATGQVEKIMADTIQPLLDRLAREETEAKNATRERNSLALGRLSLVKEANSYSYRPEQGFFASSTQGLIDAVLAKYPITRRGTRNGILTKLVGELFRKFGCALAEQIITQHYSAYNSNVRTGLAEHLREFQQAWKSFQKKELARLNHSERERFDKLQTETQQEAFFLCRSFAKLKREFPLSQASLADRLSVTRPGARYVIESLIRLGALERTAEARPHSKAACYQWIA